MKNLIGIFLAFTIFQITCSAKTLPLNLIHLPPHFQISVLSDAVPGARQMVLGSKGTLFVGTRAEGKVYALTLDQSRTKVKEINIIANHLTLPNGVAFRDGDLYVSALDRILRFKAIEQHLKNPPKPQVVYDKFPNNTYHGWKYIAFGPDGWLYVPVGAPCNVCLSKDSRFATIMRVAPDFSHAEIYVYGVRNSVGFDWDPETKLLWFTDNGRDWLGDKLPPDELNIATKQGLHFGFPFYYGNNVLDPEFGKMAPKLHFTPPVQQLGPHVASLGMKFYSGKMFPKEYYHQIFIAEHGSWNRSKKIGYRITLVKHRGNKVISYQPFATGWLQGESAWGRPVAILQMPDGSLLISDDYAGAIYRIKSVS